RARNIPDAYLRRFCLRGVDDQQGTLLVSRELRSRVQFLKLNLNAALPAIGPFDLVFLRNVMIYFDAATKRQVVERVLGQLRPGGHLFVGHAESLHGVSQSVQMVAPSIYRKP
ncbi:MAG: chemotaxis protein-glutamate O-methyltransferase, partial [Nevskia sp.]|nr:chemotaxis protein-glutamate O-methyltransferase [Nevskia sp.]